MDVFPSLYQLSAGQRSTKETLMSFKFPSFLVVVKLKIGVDSLKCKSQNHTIVLKISHLINNDLV